MLRLSKLTDYGTVIMTHMAREPERTYSAAGLAAAIGVTAPTASKILKILAGGGLLVSLRGARGGYALAQPPGEISLVRIIEVMEGPLGVTECSVTSGLCAQEGRCSIRRNWQRINQSIRNALAEVTLAQMTQTELHPVADMRGMRARGARAPM